MKSLEPKIYNNLISSILTTISNSRNNAFKLVNNELIRLNFELGKIIVESQTKHNWGKSIVTNISKDINKIVAGQKGYSPQNLWNML